MSRLPNQPQVEELAETLREIDLTASTIDESRLKVRQIEDAVKLLVTRHARLVEKAQKLMEEMDCSAPGNCGYEGRLFALLTMLARASQPEGRR